MFFNHKNLKQITAQDSMKRENTSLTSLSIALHVVSLVTALHCFLLTTVLALHCLWSRARLDYTIQFRMC